MTSGVVERVEDDSSDKTRRRRAQAPAAAPRNRLVVEALVLGDLEEQVGMLEDVAIDVPCALAPGVTSARASSSRKASRIRPS